MSKKNYKNQLRCENCNRLTEVDQDMWEELYEDTESVFLCERPTCSRISSETITSCSKTLKIYTNSSYVKELKNIYLD